MSIPLVSLRHVGLSYSRKAQPFRRQRDPFWALRDVSFDLYAGESVGIVGRNGAGKTTLLQLLAGILQPDCGEFHSSGCRASLLSIQVGFVPYLSGHENAILSGMLLGMTRREIEERMDEIVAFAELEEFIEEPIRSYSSGMRARLGFATAFQVNPDLLLIDEVLGVGDSAFVKKSSALLHERVRSDKAVVLASHNLSTLRTLCDRAIWIDKGRSRADGDAREVLAAYEDHIRSASEQKSVT